MPVIIDKNELTDFLYLAKATFGPFQFEIDGSIYDDFMYISSNKYVN